MSPLFRKSVEKVAERAAAKAEVERLRALSAGDLTAQVLAALGPNGANEGYSVRVQQLCTYLLRDFPGAGQLAPLDLLSPVRRALESLEQAGLAYTISHQRTPVWRITTLGEATLADGTIQQRLQNVE